MKRQITASFLALCMLASLTACGGSEVSTDTTAPSSADAVTETPDPLAGLDFGGETINVLVGAVDYDTQIGSYMMIIHEEEQTGDVVQDAVYDRNMAVEELLNVKFNFTKNNDTYKTIGNSLSTLILAGDSSYDYVIHDLYPLATLSVDGHFMNVYNSKYMDFSQPYWYENYMRSTSFDSDEKCYLLAGDYFLDVLRSAYAMYVNQELFEQANGSMDDLYQLVFDGKWTIDQFLSYIKNAYRDVNGSTDKDNEDIYGFTTYGYWAPTIPWVISADPTFLKYDSDGTPSFAMNNERSVKILEKLNQVFWNEASFNVATVAGVSPGERITTIFTDGQSMFSGYHRVKSLDIFRDVNFGIGLVPYPKLDESQERYITSSHDITNVGVIPITCTKFEIVDAALEALNRASAETVIPAYYEIALKDKYTRDESSAQMLDLIKNNIDHVFSVAFNSYCNNLPLKQTFSKLIEGNSNDFASAYAAAEPLASEKLAELWNAFKSGK